MKIFIVILLMIGWLKNASCFQSNSSSLNNFDDLNQKFEEPNFNKLLTDTQDLLELTINDEIKSDILDLIQEIKTAKQLQSKPLKNIRQKRQASTDCLSLQSQITKVQSDIVALQKTIANQTATLNSYNQKINDFNQKIATTSGSTKNTYQSLLNTVTSMANSIRNSINTSNNQLTILKGQETSLLSSYNSKCAVTSPCGLFAYYDPWNARTDPESKGFIGGINLADNSNAYVGYGSSVGCSSQNTAPGSISTSINSPGIRVPCGASEILDQNSAYYLQYHPSLTWVTTSISSMFTVPNTLRINSAGSTFMFGRALINGQYLLGKVYTSGTLSGLNVAGPSGSSLISSGFEVLTCAVAQSCPCSSPTEAPATFAPITSAPTLPPVITQSPTLPSIVTQSSIATQPPVTTTASTSNAQSRPVFCYWPQYRAWSAIDPSLCTHITTAFFSIDGSGAIAPQGDTSKFLALKSSHPNVKLLISIGGGGGGYDVNFLAVASNPTLRANFVNNVLNYIQSNSIHGVDIDWENVDPQPNQAQYLGDLLQDLWNALNPKGYLVTIAVHVDNNKNPARYDIPRMVNNVNFINLMTYDYHGSWESVTGFNTPLYSPISTIYTVDASTQYWISKVGSKKNLLLLGFALYGKAWSTSGSTVGSSGIGAEAMTYSEICKNIKFNGWTEGYDSTQKAAYAYGGGKWVGYDNKQSIQDKINYLNSNGLGGAMIWEIGQDDLTNECGGGSHPLTTLIKNAMGGSSSLQPVPTNPPVTFAPTQAPQTTSPPLSSGPFSCPGAGLFANPSDCSSFYNCGYAGASPPPNACGSGLRWNDINKYCDYAANVPNCGTVTSAPSVTYPPIQQPPSSSVQFTGDLTYYNEWNGAYGSCGLQRSLTDPFYVAALSVNRMSGSPNPNNHPLCAADKCIKIKGAKGTVIVKISDTCGACKYDDVDIADSVFPLVDDPIKGRVQVTWEFCDCSVLGKV